MASVYTARGAARCGEVASDQYRPRPLRCGYPFVYSLTSRRTKGVALHRGPRRRGARCAYSCVAAANRSGKAKATAEGGINFIGFIGFREVRSRNRHIVASGGVRKCNSAT